VSAGERLFVVLLSMSFLALIGLDLAHSFSPNKWSALFVLLFWGPLLCLHEAAHALAARSVGWHVSEVVIGFGRELLRFRVGSTRVRLRAMPVEGYVVPSPNDTRGGRWKQAWIYAAGPLSELCVLGAVALLLDFQLPAAGDSVGRIALQSLGVTAALGVLCTLVPYAAGGHASDGLGIVLSLFTPKESFRQRLCWPFLSDARRLLLREQVALAQRRVEEGLQQFPEDPRLLGVRAVCEAAAGQPERAYQMLEELGPPEKQLPLVRAELLADAAWAVLFSAQRELYSEAQRALGQALELTPQDLHYQILLGRVQLEQGRPEQAYTQLMAAYKRTRDVDQEAQCVAYLALSCSELKDVAGAPPAANYAGRFAQAAERLDIPPALLQRVKLVARKG
jgi:tetratricopeptide (TPR) repeat protein